MDFVNTAAQRETMACLSVSSILVSPPTCFSIPFSRRHSRVDDSVDDKLQKIMSTAVTVPGRSMPSQLDLRNTAGRPTSREQVLAQATTLSAPTYDPKDANKTGPVGTKPKRAHVQRDRNRMKCTRCIMHKRGCDGKLPQCENCQKSSKLCEWVEPGVTR